MRKGRTGISIDVYSTAAFTRNIAVDYRKAIHNCVSVFTVVERKGPTNACTVNNRLLNNTGILRSGTDQFDVLSSAKVNIALICALIDNNRVAASGNCLAAGARVRKSRLNRRMVVALTLTNRSDIRLPESKSNYVVRIHIYIIDLQNRDQAVRIIPAFNVIVQIGLCP
ncbi:hypothetical protein ES703_60172 [subsurface metagenome]